MRQVKKQKVKEVSKHKEEDDLIKPLIGKMCRIYMLSHVPSVVYNVYIEGTITNVSKYEVEVKTNKGRKHVLMKHAIAFIELLD